MNDRETLQIWRSLFPKIAESGKTIEVKLKGQKFKFQKPTNGDTSTTSRRYLGYGR